MLLSWPSSVRFAARGAGVGVAMAVCFCAVQPPRTGSAGVVMVCIRFGVTTRLRDEVESVPGGKGERGSPLIGRRDPSAFTADEGAGDEREEALAFAG